MKLGVFIALALCVSASIATARPQTLPEQAAARSRAGDHAAAIELYRQAYELDSNPGFLVRIAHEHRLAGDAHEALAYFCSYIYVDAAGELADEASKNAQALAAKLGNPTDSDHDACATKSKALASNTAKTSPRANADLISEVVARPPPRITKREVAGMITLGGSLASLGLALLEQHRIKLIRDELDADAPGIDIDGLEDRKSDAQLRTKIFLGIGGAALITGGILYITGRADRIRAERAYVAPSLLKNGAGAVYGRRF